MIKILVFSIFVFFASCNLTKSGVKKEHEKSSSLNQNQLTLIMSEQYSGLSNSENLIVSDAKSLKRFFSKINRTRKPGLPIPNVDFLKNVVLIVCVGKTRSSSKPELYISEEATSILLSTKLQAVEKSAATTSVTSPFYMYTMPISKKEILFSKE